MNGRPSYQFSSCVLRPTIGIYDYNSFTGKAFENACLNGLKNGLDGLGMIVCRQANQNVYLAHINELAKKIIWQQSLFRQFGPSKRTVDFPGYGSR